MFPQIDTPLICTFVSIPSDRACQIPWKRLPFQRRVSPVPFPQRGLSAWLPESLVLRHLVSRFLGRGTSWSLSDASAICSHGICHVISKNGQLRASFQFPLEIDSSGSAVCVSRMLPPVYLPRVFWGMRLPLRWHTHEIRNKRAPFLPPSEEFDKWGTQTLLHPSGDKTEAPCSHFGASAKPRHSCSSQARPWHSTAYWSKTDRRK